MLPRPPARRLLARVAARALVAGAFFFVLRTPCVNAHGLDANRVQVVLHERSAEVVATVPSEFLTLADEDHNGLLTVRELGAHREEALRALVASIELTDEAGRPGGLDRADVSVPRGLDYDPARGAEFVRLTAVFRWGVAPGALAVRCSFVGTHPVSVFATRAATGAAPGTLTLVGDNEYGTLATPRAAVTLLRAHTSAPPAAAVAQPPARALPSVVPHPRGHPARWIAVALFVTGALVASLKRPRS